MRKRKERQVEGRRDEAQQLRTQAAESARDVGQARVEAKEAEARAERLRLEAEEAERSAAEARQGYQVEEARVEDRVREADRVDPDVDHETRSYDGNLAQSPEEGPTRGTGRM
jgi:hypothetical protein